MADGKSVPASQSSLVLALLTSTPILPLSIITSPVETYSLVPSKILDRHVKYLNKLQFEVLNVRQRIDKLLGPVL